MHVQAGSWLTSLDSPNAQLWSVALQLVEAVAFMHEHNVTHMDLWSCGRTLENYVQAVMPLEIVQNSWR
ncbi:hypothetical protein EV363DRAFT_1184191 [Boletus edulis]|nr:hypothetical protein EV363DRAFT_1184191 [Boletus edulis]